MHKQRQSCRLSRPSDDMLPAALLLAALLGRESIVYELFISIFAVKLFSLASSDGLRAVFARQPSMRYVQGSALAALALQLAGAIIAALILQRVHPQPLMLWYIGSAALLNTEHVFYEYLFAVGDGQSAMLCRAITSLLTLAGLLLCAPPSASAPASPAWLPATSGLSAFTGLTVCLALGGPLKPKLNGEILRLSPQSLLRALLYPALALGISAALKLGPAAAIPLCAGWILYALCGTPFRRSPGEAMPLISCLGMACAAAIVAGLFSRFSGHPALQTIPCVSGAILLAAACAFALYGNIPGKEAAAP